MLVWRSPSLDRQCDVAFLNLETGENVNFSIALLSNLSMSYGLGAEHIVQTLTLFPWRKDMVGEPHAIYLAILLI